MRKKIEALTFTKEFSSTSTTKFFKSSHFYKGIQRHLDHLKI